MPFVLLGLGCVITFIVYELGGGFGLILLWPATNLFAMAMAYSLGLVHVYAKSPLGIIPFWAWSIFLPYLSYSLLIWHIVRLVSTESPFDNVNERLAIGRRLLQSELNTKFDVVLDLTAEFSEPREVRSLPSYRNFQILDASAPSIEALREVLESIPNESRVFVHCAQGHGRTGLVGAAILLHRKLAQTPEDAVAMLKKVRPLVNLKPEQFACLCEYAKVL